MPTRSAAKAWRKSEERRQRNRSTRSAAKTQVRSAVESIAAAPEQSEEAVRMAVSSLDRAAQRGALHPNTVARRKSRLMRRHHTAVVAAAAAAAKAEAKPARGAKAKEKKEEKKAPAKTERGKKPKK